MKFKMSEYLLKNNKVDQFECLVIVVYSIEYIPTSLELELN